MTQSMHAVWQQWKHWKRQRATNVQRVLVQTELKLL
jgi:hypothetical protein